MGVVGWRGCRRDWLLLLVVGLGLGLGLCSIRITPSHRLTVAVVVLVRRSVRIIPHFADLLVAECLFRTTHHLAVVVVVVVVAAVAVQQPARIIHHHPAAVVAVVLDPQTQIGHSSVEVATFVETLTRIILYPAVAVAVAAAAARDSMLLHHRRKDHHHHHHHYPIVVAAATTRTFHRRHPLSAVWIVQYYSQRGQFQYLVAEHR